MSVPRQPPRRIGVIGGMGPEATVLFMSKLLRATSARDDSDHIPLLVDSNTQVPSRIEALIEGTGDDPAPVLAAMARRLIDAGAEALAMPCNTAHNYADTIRDAAEGVPFLDMVQATIRHLARQPSPPRKVGILGSTALIRTGLYDRALAAASMAALYPAAQDSVLAAIRAIKADRFDDATRADLQRAIRELEQAGAETILIACSEFSIITDRLTASIPTLDTLDILVGETKSFALAPDS